MKNLTATWALAVTVLVSACGGVPMGPPESAPQPSEDAGHTDAGVLVDEAAAPDVIALPDAGTPVEVDTGVDAQTERDAGTTPDVQSAPDAEGVPDVATHLEAGVDAGGRLCCDMAASGCSNAPVECGPSRKWSCDFNSAGQGTLCSLAACQTLGAPCGLGPTTCVGVIVACP
jgi:hypothetical protein